MSFSSPFVGRVAELAALEEALAGAILGRGGAVVLSGEPGIGKTRLASELGDRAERRGARVLWARCATDAEAPAYWPFAQLLAPLYAFDDPAELLRRFGPGAVDAMAIIGRGRDAEAPRRDDHAAAPTEQQRFRLFDAVSTMLVAAAAERPVVLVFDDIHAADPGCLQLLVFLVRALRNKRMLVVATMRAAEARRREVAPVLLGTLAREALALSVDGWSREEVGAFLTRRRDRGAGSMLVEDVHRASAGNPFFVGEIARMLRPDEESGERFPVPAHVRQAVLARLVALEPSTPAVLKAAAVAGLSFETRTVSAIAGLDAGEVAACLDEAVDAGFVDRAGEASWSFRHEIARDVLYEDQGAGERRRGHLRAADELARVARGRESLAHHLLCALPDSSLEATVALVLAVAESAATATAHERAASWLRRGLEAISQHGPSPAGPATTRTRAPAARKRALARDPVAVLHGRLLLALGDSSWAAGDLAGSRQAYEDAATLARRDEDAGHVDAALLAGAALGLGGRQQRAHVQFDARVVALLERAIAAIGDDSPALHARLEARLAYALYAAPGSRPEREERSTRALQLARNGCDADTLRWVLGDHRWARWGPANLGERRAVGEELLAAARRRGDREAALVEHGWRLVDSLELGERGAVDEAFAAYRGGAAELRLPWYEWYATRFACLMAQVEGRLDDAERLAGEAMAAGERAGHPDAALAFGTQMFGVRLAQDRAAELESAVELSVAQYPDVLLWRSLLSRVRVAQGRDAEAAGEIERTRRGPLVEAPGDYLHLPSLVILAEVAAAVGDDEVRTRVRDALDPFSGRQVILGFGMAFLGPVDQYLGELSAACGLVDEARAQFERATLQASRLGAMRWASRARLALRTIGDSRSRAPSSRSEPRETAATGDGRGAGRARLEADGNGWRGEFAGSSFRVGALRGLVYLRALLEVPERELHVLELVSLGEANDGSDRGLAAVSDRADRSDAGPLLDDQAKRAYRRRLAELKTELDEATDFADTGRIAIARAEIEALEDELARAIGLGGRDRRSGAAAERARVAVAKRIRGALERIGEQSPELQRYFEATVRTGVFCVYRPDPGRPVEWDLPVPPAPRRR